jgi:hypothetical protein
VDIQAIVAMRHAGVRKNTDTLVLGGDMFIDNSNQMISGLGAGTSNSKIVDLTSDKDKRPINYATIQVTFMSCCGEIKRGTLEDLKYKVLPEATSFGMPLNCAERRNHISPGIKVDAKSFLVPRTISFVGLQMTRFGGRWRALVCIVDVAVGNNHAKENTQGEEQFHTWLFNAGCIGLSSVAKPWSCSFRAINTRASFPTAVCLDTTRPLDA